MFLVFTLGWGWAALRVVLGVVLVLGTAALAARIAPGRLGAETARANADSRAELVEAAGEVDEAAPRPHWLLVWLRALARLTVSLVPEYVVLVLALGAFRVLLFPQAGPQLGNDPLVVIGLATAGTLFAIPTAGEIAIIQTMRGFGMGAGPAGALLLSLPSISLPSAVMVWRVFPRRVVGLMLATTIAISFLGGLIAIALGL